VRLNGKNLIPLLVPWLLALGSACQGTSPTASREPAVTVRPAGSPTPARPVTTAMTATPTGLAGQVLAASDVSGQPDVPLPDQLVLAVPVDEADEALGLGTASLDEAELRFLKADLAAPHPAVVVALTDSAGSYRLSLSPGDYLLCLADSDAMPLGLPARTRGCGRATVTGGTVRRIDISSGFGEILLVTP